MNRRTGLSTVDRITDLLRVHGIDGPADESGGCRAAYAQKILTALCFDIRPETEQWWALYRALLARTDWKNARSCASAILAIMRGPGSETGPASGALEIWERMRDEYDAREGVTP